MRKIIDFFYKTFQDEKGKPSSKKVTGFWLIVLSSYSVFYYHYLLDGYASGKFIVNQYTVVILDANYAMTLLLLSAALLMFGVITVQALTTLWRGNKTNVIINEKVETKKETTTTDNNEA